MDKVVYAGLASNHFNKETGFDDGDYFTKKIDVVKAKHHLSGAIKPIDALELCKILNSDCEISYYFRVIASEDYIDYSDKKYVNTNVFYVLDQYSLDKFLSECNADFRLDGFNEADGYFYSEEINSVIHLNKINSKIISLGDYSTISSNDAYIRIISQGSNARIIVNGHDSTVISTGSNSAHTVSGGTAIVLVTGDDCNTELLSNSCRANFTGKNNNVHSFGNYSRIKCSGKDSRIHASGRFSHVKGVEGTEISIADYDDDGNFNKIVSGIIGSDNLIPDVFYRVTKGEFTPFI